MNRTLAIPHPTALHRSNTLLNQIRLAIRKTPEGISFADYMERALYTPALGYYSGPTSPFGLNGDFITAPEISPLLSRCLAKQCAQLIEALGKNISVLEIGAGTGRMAAALLLALEKENSLPAHYWIFEKSLSLRQRQAHTIKTDCPQFLDRIHWLDTLPIKPFKGIVLSNEVLDAMPVHRFCMINNHCYEIKVIEKDDRLSEALVLTQNPNLKDLEVLQQWPQYYSSEINLHIKPWINELSRCLEQGVVFIIDYGFGQTEYYHPDRRQGTLMCHYQHQAHTDPFLYPGLQDISSHVNFTAVADAALDTQFDCLGYTHQAAFLLGCGIEKETNFEHLSLSKKLLQQQALYQLTAPSEMGELFKVMALGRDFNAPLMGFSWLDRRHVL